MFSFFILFIAGSTVRSQGTSPFIAAWAPIRSLTNPKLQMSHYTGHPVGACCGSGCVLGDVDIHSQYSLDVRTNAGFTFNLSNSTVPFANWVRDEDLRYAQGKVLFLFEFSMSTYVF